MCEIEKFKSIVDSGDFKANPHFRFVVELDYLGYFLIRNNRVS
jgi:hypothetical protein